MTGTVSRRGWICGLLFLWGCGKPSGPTLATSMTDRLTLRADTVQINGQSVKDSPWELPRGEIVEIQVEMKAGTWGLSRIPIHLMSPRAVEPPPRKPSTASPQTDPSLTFLLFVISNGSWSSNAIHSTNYGGFVPGKQPDEGTLTYMLPKFDKPGDYTLRFVADSAGTGTGFHVAVKSEPTVLGEQFVRVR